MKLRSAALLTGFLLAAGSAPAGPISVTTYHYDNMRTGWNQLETGLKPSNVKSANFGLLHSTRLDDQVDAQPLVLGSQKIAGHGGKHEVVYVATESNTIYAIDGNSGHVLLTRNFGNPVPFTELPGGCNNNGPNIGINSTPVIDPETNTLYVVTDTFEANHAVYRVHALDPQDLSDKVAPVVVGASGKLTDGSTYNFNAFASRLRAGLLIANGNLYAGFASYCDVDADQSRGWVLGWQLDTLTPLASNQLNNKLAHSTDDFFLTSIWMSGYGLASNLAGDIYFVTGNADFSGDSYNRVTNLAESVVQVSGDLTTVKSFFTPFGDLGWQNLDQWDADFGSGGAMLLPPQPNSEANILVAAGKVGVMYVLNADDLNNGKPKGGKAFSTADVGACWCGPSYYKASDGFGRVVSSGNNTVGVWKVQAGGAKPKLVMKNQPGDVEGAQFPGFFTSVSSNGTLKNTAVVWAVGRPTDSGPAKIKLFAFDPDKQGALFSAVAGSWPNTGGDSNIVPVVANSKVYVAADQSLSIFGISPGGLQKIVLPEPKRVDTRVVLAPGVHELYGTVLRVRGTAIEIRARDGRTVRIDATEAKAKYDVAQPWVGHALMARGRYGQDGTLHAALVFHAKDSPAMWLSDR
ncbi:MAG TPA: hypothetical protein VG889_19910 [Rhizomicrobium sp.]|nr:hypothetical protein [Rhizomicrobium sp.]